VLTHFPALQTETFEALMVALAVGGKIRQNQIKKGSALDKAQVPSDGEIMSLLSTPPEPQTLCMVCSYADGKVWSREWG